MPAGTYVAEDRETSILFRLSHAEKAAIRHEAAELGLTVQALMERKLLGKEGVVRHGGRRPRPQQEMLPLTG